MQANRAATSSPIEGRSVRIPVDVRRFPWIRRLAADYAYDFRAVAPFFAGDPSDRSAWADAIARTQQHERRRSDVARVIEAQQERPQATNARLTVPLLYLLLTSRVAAGSPSNKSLGPHGFYSSWPSRGVDQ